ncbi:MAG: hypothetical protein CL845_08955 [Crocinitomicaceae bacterium]|nr:hypothetical protein [Crocinitomicaceae bacterium]
METARLNRLLQTALKAAAEGSAVLLRHLSHQNNRLVIRSKRDGSPVSAVDLESHEVIQGILAPHSIPIISEEGTLPPFIERTNWPLFWLVDPLDGTQSYIDHRKGFAINIALCDKTGPILGIVADPLSNRIFAGTKIKSPFTVSLSNLNESQPIVPLAATRPYRLVTSWNETLSKEELLPPSLNADAFRMEAVSGALKFCLLATGEADVHARSASYMEWDCAAGDGILRSMGIAVRNRTTGQPLRYNSMSLRVGDLYASRLQDPSI